jgi:hypothetical protein
MIATFYDRSVGFADDHAFQLSVDKRFSSGLAYQVAYTYSKALTENDGWFGAEGKNVADPYDPRASLSPAGYDMPHLLTVNANYELPVGQGKRFSIGSHAVDYIIGNWQVNGILSVRSGQRYSVIDGSGDPANTGNQGWAGYEQVEFGRRPEFGLVFERGASVHAKLLDQYKRLPGASIHIRQHSSQCVSGATLLERICPSSVASRSGVRI